jgi:hypothetical protein
MPMQRLPVFAFLALAASASAQDFLGIMNRTDTSFTSRGSTTIPNTNPSQVLERLDKEHYAGWGVSPANPGMRAIVGMHAWLQDQIGTTPETFGFVVYTENLAAPNYADVTTPLGSVGPLPTPANAVTGAIAFEVTASFATPVLAPASGDVFVAVDLPQPVVGGPWPADGMSCHALYYVGVGGTGPATYFDLAGASLPTTPPEQAGNGSWYVPSPATGPLYTVTPRQWKVEPIVNGAAGVAGTITNQISLPSSSTAPGTSSQGSGLHPDAANPPLNAGRTDDLAGRWIRTGTPTNTPVFFLMDLGTFGTEIPVSAFLAGSTGVLCLNPASMVVVGLTFTVGSEAFLQITIPTAARARVAGLNVLHQAAALNVVTATADANGCTRQIL